MFSVGKKNKKNEKKIVTENSLQCFFFDELKKINDQSKSQISNEVIYYSSLVLDKYGCSSNYFDVSEGRVRDKVLGIKLLECKNFNKNKKKKVVKDIAETSLMLCGYFSNSVNNKFNQLSYYQSIGRSAYNQLNVLEPTFYDMPEFYRHISEIFQSIAECISVIADKFNNHYEPTLIFREQTTRKKAS